MSEILYASKTEKTKKPLIIILAILIIAVLVFAGYRFVFAENAKITFFTAIDNEIKKASSIDMEEGNGIFDGLMEAVLMESHIRWLWSVPPSKSRLVTLSGRSSFLTRQRSAKPLLRNACRARLPHHAMVRIREEVWTSTSWRT